MNVSLRSLCANVSVKRWPTSVGVAPAFQGQGYGRALLQPMLDRAELEGLPCYLETTQANNVSFYRRLGFDVLVEDVEPESGLRVWTFRKG